MSESFLPARSATTIGQSVRALRQQSALTQAQLAAKVGVSRQWINGIENGTNKRAEMWLVLRVFDELRAPLFARILPRKEHVSD